MKTTKNIILATLLVFVFVGCTKDFVEGFSTDPSQLQTAEVNNLLTSAQQQTGWPHGDELARITEVLVQRSKGNGRQALAYNRYALTESNSNNDWGNNWYGGAMKDLDVIIKQGNMQGANHYVGVAKILMAINLGTLTDLFGDIPYTEAFQGADNLNPMYDSQENIYSTILSLCDEGISSLGKNGISSLNLSGFDQIYGGDLDKWIKLAHAIKARHLNHLSKLPQYNATDILNELNNALTSNSDNAVISYESTAIKGNPWAQFTVDRTDLDYVTGTPFAKMITNDPRKAIFEKMNNTSSSGENGGFYGNFNSDLLLYTFHEMKFIEAEVRFRQGGTVAATNALVAAITANMEMLGIAKSEINTYLSSLPVTSLATIMNEKYKALYTQMESWTDWRRTGFPNLTTNPYSSNLEINEIPRRLPYPQTERLYNKNFKDLSSSENRTQRMWWDQ